MGERLRQLQKFCTEFLRRKPQKNSAKVFAKKGWAAQGFKAKKCLKAEPAAAPQGSQPIKVKNAGLF
ncbi:MAG: hypothetical protein SPE49_08720 [Campylobacter sp.]|uniref:hypothetical protein n=1 Tax=Campylobacter sp. TaxID=205 RepID=UPI002A7F0E99|nr:hypothetical protein [Campylobacter sp.]MDY5116029.1 hypothetical protein [Campylobacter sp.]